MQPVMQPTSSHDRLVQSTRPFSGGGGLKVGVGLKAK